MSVIPTAMSSTVQPPKRRKPYDPSEPAATPLPESSEPQPPVAQTNPYGFLPNLTPEEIARKRRNQEEIANFYQSYKRLKTCVSEKDARTMPELEQAYLSLITAARGCASVQRLVADFVPKYASYCPTALEAAMKVCINIYNSSITNINKGDDVDGFPFLIAKLCVFGLATVCQAASSASPTSSVIQGICSAVFLNVLTFLISSFEGRDIFQIVNKDVVKMYDCPKTFSELKEKFSKADEAIPVKLSKCRALCILWIFFSCPRNSLAACFELCSSNSTDADNGGQYFLNQVTAGLDTSDGQVSVDNTLPENCLLGLVLNKDPSLKQWIFSRVKSISKSASPNVVAAITSAFERIFESFTEQVKAQDKQVDCDADDTSPSKSIHRPFLVPKNSNHPGDAADQVSGLHLESETDIRSNTSSNNSGAPKSNDLDSVDHKELSRASSSTPRDQSSNHISSMLGNSFDGKAYSESGVNSNFESPKHHLPSPHPSTSQPIWLSDGNRAAMDIYSASRHLWVGLLGPESSEPLVRFQFERFGPIYKLLYVPFKGFAVIEYLNIMDAVKAREIMRGRSPWGSYLVIKFLDIGLGTRGDINGVAIGSCCHVYVGNIQSQSDKDEILYEVRKMIFKGPLSVDDLMSEGAILMEFGNPEEAATVMAHLRQHRKEKKNFINGSAPLHVGNCIVSSPHAQSMTGFSGKHNTNTVELTSPRINMLNQGATMQIGNPYPFQSNWNYGNQEGVSLSTPMHGHSYPSSHPMQQPSSSYMRPMYYPPNSPWDAHGMIHHTPFNPISSGVMPNNFHNNNNNNNHVAPPFLPPSVTPLSQIQGSSLPHHDHMFYAPPSLPPQQNMPPPLPVHPEMPPPLPPSPPPSLEFQPPPPPPPIESSMPGSGGYWQGTLSKSGVHYSTVHARRLHSDACNYGDSVSEPAEWPAKLDITKRTDYKHVMSTFSSTPPHKREVCQLLPTSAGDHKGFEDFMSYLKQRECAGVIKIPATKTVWARLLFILPYSNETCSHLSVAPDTPECLIALVLPKETNFEWV